MTRVLGVLLRVYNAEGLNADIVQIGAASISRNVFAPGAHCALGGARMVENRLAEQSCQAHHSGVVLEGRLHVEMDDGSVLDVGPNHVFDIPPGHDGWVVSDDDFRAINWSGVRTWLPDPETGQRVVVTILITDIVKSTELASRIGDATWRDLLGRHNREVRDQLDRYRGGEVKTTGDGFLAIFDGAARAVRAAIGIQERAKELGLQVRIGAHTGEVAIVGDDIEGAAVHEAARIAADATDAEILVSSTTRQLATGAGLDFEYVGEREFKGIQGSRSVYTLIR